MNARKVRKLKNDTNEDKDFIKHVSSNRLAVNNSKKTEKKQIKNKKKLKKQEDETFLKAIYTYTIDHFKIMGNIMFYILKILLIIFVFIYITLPTALLIRPSLSVNLVFLQHLSWPPFRNLTDPRKYDLKKSYQMQIQTDGLHKLGAWLILSKHDTNHYDYTDKNISLALNSNVPTFLYLHGNSGTRGSWHRVKLYRVLSEKAGYNVLAIDYSGYGDSTGYPSENNVINDAKIAYQWLKSRCKGPIYIWGHSLGTAVSLGLAQYLSHIKQPPIGIVLEAPFTKLRDTALYFPLAIPFMIVKPISEIFLKAFEDSGLQFLSEERITQIDSPFLILHAKDDYIVPLFLGEKLVYIAKAALKNVVFNVYETNLGYGHKHIHKDPNLHKLISEFVYNCSVISSP